MQIFLQAVILVMIVFTAGHGEAEKFPIEQLDKILEENNYDYRQEIEEDVFKPCLQYYLKTIERRHASIGWNYNEKLIHSELSLLAMKLRKLEPSIYYEVISQNAEMRSAVYAMTLAQCKKQVDKKW